MVYAFDEQFVLPISHDEVVHGKGSMITKMPGDAWQKFANLRAFSAYMYFHPGKKLNFMGNEFAQGQEWSHERSLDWHLLETSYHKAQQTLSKDLNHLYTNEPSLQFDHSYQGFEWISYDDSANSILVFARKAKDSDEHVIAVINFTPTPHGNYRIGVPKAGRYEIVMDTDEVSYTGSGYAKVKTYQTQAIVSHGREQSIELQVPPLAGVLLKMAS